MNNFICLIEDFYQSREPRIYIDYSPCIRADRTGLKIIEKDEEDIYRRSDERAET